jgi:hypothetical protein
VDASPAGGGPPVGGRGKSRASANLAAAIYGLITVSVLIAAETARSETYPKTVAAVAVAILLYWLSMSYAEFASQRVREGRSLTLGDLVRTMRHELPLLVGASLPLVAVLISWAVGAPLDRADDAALWTDVAAIVAIEIIAGVRAALSGRELLLQTVVGATLGLLVLALRLVVH